MAVPALCLGIAALVGVPSAIAGVRSGTFHSASLDREVAYVVQLPPGYASAQHDFPVIYVLHGLFEGPEFWQRRGLAALLDAAWQAGTLPELVVAGVDGGNSFFVNGPAGAWQDMLTRDFVDHVESRYRVRSQRESRGLLGISMGGYAALRLAFTRSELFGAVATHSAMLLEGIPSAAAGAGRWQMAAFHGAFGEPIDVRLWRSADPLALASAAAAPGLPALYLDCGAADRYGLAAGHRALHALLEESGVPHEFALPPGDHGYAFVRGRLATSLAFLARHLDMTASPSGGQRKGDP